MSTSVNGDGSVAAAVRSGMQALTLHGSDINGNSSSTLVSPPVPVRAAIVSASVPSSVIDINASAAAANAAGITNAVLHATNGTTVACRTISDTTATPDAISATASASAASAVCGNASEQSKKKLAFSYSFIAKQSANKPVVNNLAGTSTTNNNGNNSNNDHTIHNNNNSDSHGHLTMSNSEMSGHEGKDDDEDPDLNVPVCIFFLRGGPGACRYGQYCRYLHYDSNSPDGFSVPIVKQSTSSSPAAGESSILRPHVSASRKGSAASYNEMNSEYGDSDDEHEAYNPYQNNDAAIEDAILDDNARLHIADNDDENDHDDDEYYYDNNINGYDQHHNDTYGASYNDGHRDANANENKTYYDDNFIQYDAEGNVLEHPDNDVEATEKERIGSMDLTCGSCHEKVIALGRRFGMLSSCDHPFCLPCIREYRAGNSFQEWYDGKKERENLKNCPICNEESHFIIPCNRMVFDEHRKEFLINQYKGRLNLIPCKYFAQGYGSCPFGSSCFYAHVDKDGNHIEVTRNRERRNADGVLEVYQTQLSDFFANLG